MIESLIALSKDYPWLNPSLFTTAWGLLYLTVLVLLMVPALFFKNKGGLAMGMFVLFACDRLSVHLLAPSIALFFLAFAYFLVTVAIVFTHRGRAAMIAGISLLVTSIAFIAGGFDIIDWDITGSIQEFFGLVAMLAIIFRRQNGGRAHAGAMDALAADRGRDFPAGVSARSRSRQHPKK